MAGQDHAVDAGAVAAADDRAEVAGVGDAVDGDEERRPALDGAGSTSRSRPRGGPTPGRARPAAPRCGPPPRACVRPTYDERDPVRRGEGDDVLDRVVALEVGRDPDLVDLAALGDQQLAHGLAALDLLAAEVLAGFLTGFAVAAAVAPVGCRTGPVRPAPRLWYGRGPERPPGFVDPTWRDRPRRRRRPGASDAVAAASAFSPSAIWACRGQRGSWRVPVDHGDGPARDALDAADRAEPLRPPALDRHRRADGVAEAALHLVAAGRQLRSLAHHRARRRCRSPSPRHGRARPRGAAARSSRHPPTRGRCRGSAAEVAEPGRAEQGLGHGMGDGVAVAVPAQATLALERAPAEHQRRGPDRRRSGARRSPDRRGSRRSSWPRPARLGAPTRGRRGR